MKGWQRVSECKACGQGRCVESTVNERVGYCYRYGTHFFINRDGSTNLDQKKWRDKEKNQQSFDFGDSNNDHLDAIKG